VIRQDSTSLPSSKTYSVPAHFRLPLGRHEKDGLRQL